MTVIESAGPFYYSVTRMGDGVGAASVDFTTVDGTALAGVEFAATAGTLTWADGETGPKHFPITLLDNALLDGQNAFSLNFSNPSGGVISGPASATVTILDDEVAPVIVAQPQSIAVKQGLSAQFRVGVSSPVPVTFQWYKNGTIIAGATGPPLTLTNVSAGDAADYTVEISNGGTPIPSDPATLTVIPPATSLDSGYAPSGIASFQHVTFLPDGSIWVGGNFGTYNGAPVPRLVRLKGEASGSEEPFDMFVAGLPEGQRGANDDPDGDGFPNLIEFIFGTDPGSGSSSPARLSAGTALTGASLNADFGLTLDSE